jgi:hypothetical protein
MKVYLDDEREAPPGWQLVKTVNDAIELLKRGNVTEISLDHDLGGDESGTGYDIILWIEKVVVEKNLIPPKIHIHTANISARTKMELGARKILELSNNKLKLK